jgi:hypothetical protein
VKKGEKIYKKARSDDLRQTRCSSYKGFNNIKGSEFLSDIIYYSLLLLYLRFLLKRSFDYVSYFKSSKSNNPITLYYYITLINYHNRDLLLKGSLNRVISELGTIYTELLKKLKIVL